jgi:hypothetical protein
MRLLVRDLFQQVCAGASEDANLENMCISQILRCYAGKMKVRYAVAN